MQKGEDMDIHVCSCCGEIIENQDYHCKTCNSHFCFKCHENLGEHCNSCGDII